MADATDEARIIAWLDGELAPVEAAAVERAVASDEALAALAARHRGLQERFTAAFAPLAAAPPGAAVVSLAAVRAQREPRRWAMPAAIAASLVLGVLFGRALPSNQPIDDRSDALALSEPISRALTDRPSGTPGSVQLVLSFRNHDGHFCRSFTATQLSGIACREDGQWRLRYGERMHAAASDYRMAAGDRDRMRAVEAMIDGDPLDHHAETNARQAGWR